MPFFGVFPVNVFFIVEVRTEISGWESNQSQGSKMGDDSVIDNLLDANYTASFSVERSSAMTSEDFDTTSDYGMSVAYVVICIYASGIISLLLFWFDMLSRCCIPCCRCIPKPSAESSNFNSQPGTAGAVAAWTSYRTALESAFYTSIVSALVFNVFTIVGRNSLTAGLDHIESAVNQFGDIVTDVSEDGDQLLIYGRNLTVLAELASQSCAYATIYGSQLNSSIYSYINSVQDMQETADTLNDAVDGLDKYFNYYADGAVFIGLFGVVSILLIAQGVCHALESNYGMKVILSFNNFTFFTIITAGVAWCTLSVLIGDLCVAPSYNLVHALPEGDAKNITTYYATCYGTSTVDASLDEGKSSAAQFDFYLGLILQLPGCMNNPDILAMQDVVGQINGTLFHLYNLTDCGTLQGIYNEIIYTGLCENGAEGLYYIWGSQILVAAMLFISIVLGVLAYQFYLPPKDITDSEHGRLIVPVGMDCAAADTEHGLSPMPDEAEDYLAVPSPDPPGHPTSHWSLGVDQRVQPERLAVPTVEPNGADSQQQVGIVSDREHVAAF